MGTGDSDKAQRSAKSGDRRAQQAGGQHSCSPYPLDIRSRTEGKVVTEEQKVKAEYKERLNKIKSADYTPSVIIKASDGATYDNLIQVLDEMQICSIGRYVIDKFVDGDKAKIKALKDGTAQ